MNRYITDEQAAKGWHGYFDSEITGKDGLYDHALETRKTLLDLLLADHPGVNPECETCRLITEIRGRKP